jgi:hypothetical protein
VGSAIADACGGAAPEARSWAANATTDFLESFRGQPVVCDLAEPFLAIGTLSGFSADHLELTEADLHDQREANSTKEVYALETRQLGIRANRRRVVIPRRQLVAISLLADL